MRFARRFIAVCVLTAAVIGLGVVWSHTGAADLVADGRGRDRRELPTSSVSPAEGSPALDGAEEVRERRFDRRGDHGGVVDRVADLVQTIAVEALIVGAVVVIDRRRRRRHSRRRIARRVSST